MIFQVIVKIVSKNVLGNYFTFSDKILTKSNDYFLMKISTGHFKMLYGIYRQFPPKTYLHIIKHLCIFKVKLIMWNIILSHIYEYLRLVLQKISHSRLTVTVNIYWNTEMVENKNVEKRQNVQFSLNKYNYY